MAGSPTQRILADLQRAFPRPPWDTETFVLYVNECGDIPAPLLERVVRDLIRTATFRPHISEIRLAAAELTLTLPSEAAALAQVEARIAWGRKAEHERGAAPSIDPTVKAALDLIGGWAAFRSADEPSVLRGQFLRLYREARADAVRDLQTGAVALPAPDGLPALPAA